MLLLPFHCLNGTHLLVGRARHTNPSLCQLMIARGIVWSSFSFSKEWVLLGYGWSGIVWYQSVQRGRQHLLEWKHPTCDEFPLSCMNYTKKKRIGFDITKFTSILNQFVDTHYGLLFLGGAVMASLFLIITTYRNFILCLLRERTRIIRLAKERESRIILPKSNDGCRRTPV